MPDDTYYIDSEGERWWGSDETAVAAGFRRVTPMPDHPFVAVTIRCSRMDPLFVHDDDGVHEYRAVSVTRTSPTTIKAVYEAVESKPDV